MRNGDADDWLQSEPMNCYASDLELCHLRKIPDLNRERLWENFAALWSRMVRFGSVSLQRHMSEKGIFTVPVRT